MMKKWLRTLFVLSFAALLCAPSLADEPAAAPAPASNGTTAEAPAPAPAPAPAAPAETPAPAPAAPVAPAETPAPAPAAPAVPAETPAPAPAAPAAPAETPAPAPAAPAAPVTPAEAPAPAAPADPPPPAPPAPVPAAAQNPWDWGAPDAKEREWTIMAFVNGDNNLEAAALSDLKEMEAGLPADAKMDVIVLIDRADGFSTDFGDWKGARVYRVKHSEDKNAIGSEQLAELGAVDMADAGLLAQFVKTATAKFPAKKTALVMWNHGGGWKGMSNDNSSKGEMKLAAFEKTLAETAPLQPNGTFELLHFDMCLMGQSEVIAAR